MLKPRHTLYQNLFISESDAAAIKDAATTALQADSDMLVTNAYIEAVLQYLDKRGLLQLQGLDATAAQRLAEVASWHRRQRRG